MRRKNRSRNIATGAPLSVVVAQLAEGRDCTTEEATERLLAKRLRDSTRHAHRVANQHVTKLPSRPIGARRRAGGARGRSIYVQADRG